jgi:hypothetical protein
MLHYTKLEKLVRDKHTSLLNPFMSYEENGVLRIGPLTFVVTYRMDTKKVLHSNKLLPYPQMLD